METGLYYFARVIFFLKSEGLFFLAPGSHRVGSFKQLIGISLWETPQAL